MSFKIIFTIELYVNFYYIYIECVQIKKNYINNYKEIMFKINWPAVNLQQACCSHTNVILNEGKPISWHRRFDNDLVLMVVLFCRLAHQRVAADAGCPELRGTRPRTPGLLAESA